MLLEELKACLTKIRDSEELRPVAVEELQRWVWSSTDLRYDAETSTLLRDFAYDLDFRSEPESRCLTEEEVAKEEAMLLEDVDRLLRRLQDASSSSENSTH